MKTETQAGILVDVHVHGEEYKCGDCCFNHVEACNDVDCATATRADGQNVYFTKNISEFICCGKFDTCKQTCLPKEHHEKCNDVPSDGFPHDAKTSFNWMNTAATEVRATQYYQGLLDMCGPSLGISAYTAEDGSIHDSVLRAKVPLEVARLAFKLALAEDKIRSLQATIEMDSML